MKARTRRVRKQRRRAKMQAKGGGVRPHKRVGGRTGSVFKKKLKSRRSLSPPVG